MNHISTRPFESRVCPGVTISLRKTNETRRAKLTRLLGPLFERTRELTERFAQLQERGTPVFEGVDEDGKPKPKLEVLKDGETTRVKEYSTEDRVAMGNLINERDSLAALEINPIYIRWGVASVEGLEIDGRPATVEDLMGDHCPDGLVKEILEAMAENDDAFREEKQP
jgi:hypothetical protein